MISARMIICQHITHTHTPQLKLAINNKVVKSIGWKINISKISNYFFYPSNIWLNNTMTRILYL